MTFKFSIDFPLGSKFDKRPPKVPSILFYDSLKIDVLFQAENTSFELQS